MRYLCTCRAVLLARRAETTLHASLLPRSFQGLQPLPVTSACELHTQVLADVHGQFFSEAAAHAETAASSAADAAPLLGKADQERPAALPAAAMNGTGPVTSTELAEQPEPSGTGRPTRSCRPWVNQFENAALRPIRTLGS